MVKEESRLQNSKKGMSLAIINFIVKLLLSFVVRKLFLVYLNENFLGLDTLFTNILGVLSFAELGIGSAIDCVLFKPAYDKDYKKLSKYITLFRKIYLIIGLIIFVAGCALTPFVHLFMSETPDVNVNIYVIFILFVINSSIGYLFAYRFSLFNAFQKKSVHYLITTISQIIFSILQIVSLFVFKNYYLYVISSLIHTLLNSIIAYIATNKMFAEISNNEKEKLEEKDTKAFAKEVKNVSMHKLATVINTSIDGVIISKFLANGVGVLGIYSGYTMITSAITGLITYVCDAIRGSIGNLIASNDLENGYRVFKLLRLLFFWISSFCTTCIMCLSNPFLDMVFGSNYTFDTFVVVIISFNFYVSSNRIIFGVMRDAYGNFNIDRWKGLIQALLNLVISLVLVQFIGIAGVVLGTAISCLLTSTWVEPHILHKYWLKRSEKPHIWFYILFLMITALNSGISYFLCSLIGGGIINFILKMLISVITPNIVLLIVFCRTKEFKELFKIGKGLVLNFFHHKKKQNNTAIVENINASNVDVTEE